MAKRNVALRLPSIKITRESFFPKTKKGSKMKINLIGPLEYWMQSIKVQSPIIVEELETHYQSDDFYEYLTEIRDFRRQVGNELLNEGHEVTWITKQSTGYGILEQGPFISLEERANVESAIQRACEKATPAFTQAIRRHIENERRTKVEVSQ